MSAPSPSLLHATISKPIYLFVLLSLISVYANRYFCSSVLSLSVHTSNKRQGPLWASLFVFVFLLWEDEKFFFFHSFGVGNIGWEGPHIHAPPPNSWSSSYADVHMHLYLLLFFCFTSAYTPILMCVYVFTLVYLSINQYLCVFMSYSSLPKHQYLCSFMSSLESNYKPIFMFVYVVTLVYLYINIYVCLCLHSSLPLNHYLCLFMSSL